MPRAYASHQVLAKDGNLYSQIVLLLVIPCLTSALAKLYGYFCTIFSNIVASCMMIYRGVKKMISCRPRVNLTLFPGCLRGQPDLIPRLFEGQPDLIPRLFEGQPDLIPRLFDRPAWPHSQAVWGVNLTSFPGCLRGHPDLIPRLFEGPTWPHSQAVWGVNLTSFPGCLRGHPDLIPRLFEGSTWPHSQAVWGAKTALVL